jgi:hypothetical protein
MKEAAAMDGYAPKADPVMAHCAVPVRSRWAPPPVLVLVFVAFAVSLLVGVSSGSAAWGGKNGKIVFWDFGRCCDRIWSVSPDGSDLSLLLMHATQLNEIQDMDIAPDGSALLFHDDNVGELGLLPLDSPQGLGSLGIVLDSYDGPPLAEGWDRHASFSPDGSRVLWVRYPGRDPAGPAGIWVVNRDGSGKRQLVAGTTVDDPRWSPDGSEVSYQDAGTTYVIPADGSGLPVSAAAPFALSPGLSPVSPDGRKVAFVDCCDADTGSVPQVYVSNLDGTDRVRVTASLPCPPADPECGNNVTAPFAFTGFVHWQTLPDPTAPVIQSNVAGQLGNNGWYVGDVTVNWSVDDPESAIASTAGCDRTNVTSDTASLTLTCSAKNRWGTSASQATKIRRDSTPPAIAYSGNAGYYTTSQAVKIACRAADPTPGSGLATTTCRNINGSGSSFGLGTHTFTSTATDNAGNIGRGSTAFEVKRLLAGQDGLGPSIDANPAGLAEAGQAKATTSGTATTLSVYVDKSSTATKLIAGIYADEHSHPGTLLAAGTLEGNPVNGTWNTVTFPPVRLAAGTRYWITVLAPAGMGTLRFRDYCCGSVGTNPTETSRQTDLTTLPTNWVKGTRYPHDGPLTAWTG